jgi:hypothetical protein
VAPLSFNNKDHCSQFWQLQSENLLGSSPHGP